MAILFKRLAAAVVGLAFLSGCGASPKAMPNPAPSGGLRVLVFYDPSAEPTSGTILPLIAANRAAISDLAPLWYKVNADGSVTDVSTSALKTFAKNNNIKLEPLVINAGGTSSFLLNGTARQAAVTNLVKILQDNSYAGLNIDFELLKTSARSGLVSFMQALHAKAQSMGKLITIDIIPAGNGRQAAGAYNFPVLAKNASEIVLMTYDQHDDGSPPGPVADTSWVKSRVAEALKLGVPPSKLILGLADYGYDWVKGSTHAKTLPLSQIETWITQGKAKITRDASGSPHFTYTSGGVTHIVWFEDGRSILPKIALARKDHLEGLAVWMGGYETAAYWSDLRQAAGIPGGQLSTFGSGTSAKVGSASASHSSSGGSSSKAKASGSGSRSATGGSSATSGSASSGSSGSVPGSTAASSS